MTSERSRIPCLSAAAAEGTGKKQQEGRAMATLDRKVPSPEAFLGKPWSSWIDAAKLHCSDNVDLEEAGKEGGKSREVMRLNKEDMHLFGHYPAHDDFYLVVCSACNQVVKPQVFQSHCGEKPSPGGLAPGLSQPKAMGKFLQGLRFRSQADCLRSCSPCAEMLSPAGTLEKKNLPLFR
uniref:Ataxin 7 like 1 n=1 Tax=Sus scrofa TaxID=9823 RepID=A0A8D1J9S4_PIG